MPGIGVVKNIDEAAGLVKNVIKNADLEEKAAKNVLDKVDELMPALKRSMDSPSIAPLLGNIMKSSDEATGIGKKVAKSGDEVGEGIITDGSHLQNGKLNPNATYKTGEHNYIYKTNENGLIINASTENLQLKMHTGRLNHDVNTYGKEIGDHAGHLFGDRFGGSPELDNLISQAQKVNQSEFKMIENQWAKALKNKQKVTVDININYDAGSIRPSSFDVSYTIDIIPFFQSITN